MGVLLWAAPVKAYSVLTHEAIIDSTWKQQIQPLLLERYPSATPEQLEAALRGRGMRGDDAHALATMITEAGHRGQFGAAARDRWGRRARPKRVVAFFGRGGLHCFAVDGKPLRSKDLGAFPGEWGTDKNIQWKAAVPGVAWSCPIVVGDKVIVTTAVTDNQKKPKAGKGDT